MTNPFRRPKGSATVYGHRGARGVLPENTLESFRYLVATGAQGLEIDVQNAAGRVPVVVHDALLPMQIARSPDGNWLAAPGPKLRDLTVAQLQRYDMGRLNPAHPYAQSYPQQQPIDGARVPTLAAVLDWARTRPELTLNIEIKSDPTRPDLGDAPEVLAIDVLHLLTRAALEQSVLISSFDWRVLRAVRTQAPHVARGYLSLAEPGEDCTIFEGSPWMDGLSLAEFDGSLPRMIAAQQGQCWCPWFLDLTDRDLFDAHDLDVAVNVWTVNAPDDIARMLALGVDAVITDYPERALATAALV